MHSNEEAEKQRAYLESLEREVGLKRILEQNLRDLQSQYYESVRDLDNFRSSQETKESQLQSNLSELQNKLDASQTIVLDKDEQLKLLQIELNDIKESSQLVEKKYHRAKKIIKDMQLREQSFTRREQLYQQKLDEIEFELSQLIESINLTIKNDAINYYTLIKSPTNGHQDNNIPLKGQLNIFGLIKKIIDNFNRHKESQNPQIKQRVASILEQKLATLIAQQNDNSTSVIANATIVTQQQQQQLTNTTSIDGLYLGSQQNINNNSSNNNAEIINNRASCPADVSILALTTTPAPPPMPLPHPIGINGTNKIFSLPTRNNPSNIQNTNDGSPPQSVNSYPSSNSLNSLNNINNNNNSTSLNNFNHINNNLLIGSTKQALIEPTKTTTTTIANNQQQKIISDLSNQVVAPIVTNQLEQDLTSATTTTDPQNPYKTDEWHDKPVSEWTTTQVSTWLLALGLDQYISKFEDRNVNGQSLVNLDSTLLKGFGVLNSNDRNLLKKKIRELKVEMEKERRIIEKKLQRDKAKSKFII